jgi:hypothetical protein
LIFQNRSCAPATLCFGGQLAQPPSLFSQELGNPLS